jgi:hypothetical protein
MNAVWRGRRRWNGLDNMLWRCISLAIASCGTTPLLAAAEQKMGILLAAHSLIVLSHGSIVRCIILDDEKSDQFILSIATAPVSSTSVAAFVAAFPVAVAGTAAIIAVTLQFALACFQVIAAKHASNNLCS